MAHSRKPAVLLLSSGLDSAANLALGEFCDFDVKYAVTVNYGQKSASQEIAHARALALHFNIEHFVFDFQNFWQLTGRGSALMSDAVMPNPSDLDAMSVIEKSAKAVWVPNRNAVLLSLAAAAAESREMSVVVVGFNAEEAVTFPDNTADFMNKMTEAFVFSTSNQVEVRSATVSFNKAQIVQRLAERNFPFELLWSCYQNGEKHCGKCESCSRLRRALESGLPRSKSAEVVGRMF